MLNLSQSAYAGRKDGGEPSGFAGCVCGSIFAERTIKADAAHRHMDCWSRWRFLRSRIRIFTAIRISLHRFQAGTRTSRTLRRLKRRRFARGFSGLRSDSRRRDTFIYDFLYRRVAVNPNTLQVSADLIPLLSQPVRVGGPGITWFHDTRSPGPLDAVRVSTLRCGRS